MNAPSPRMVTITVDGRSLQVPEGHNLLQAILEAGIDLPYFCWHPALGAVGACRQCAITRYRDADDDTGRVDMACMNACSEGLRVSTADAASRAMRKAVIELLMSNHPHDCPVCEEGGECHLQDMTVMTGHVARRHPGPKRTHRNQDLGPCIGHEMNRCIACYRCVRYYRDYAGGTDLDVFGAHHHVYFGRAQDGTLESPFSGNLVEVCPTGVFTDKVASRHYARKWDLQSAPGICAHCAVGCNTLPGERYGRLVRVWNRYHGQINGWFLCDRGRFGHGFVEDPDRPRQARLRDGSGRREITPDEAIGRLAALHGAEGLAGVASPRASLEAAWALRAFVGAGRCFHGVAARRHAVQAALLALMRAADRIASVREAERADAVLVLGERVTHTAPRLALALRQATRNAGLARAAALRIPPWQDAAVRTLAQDLRSPLILLTPAPDPLAEVASSLRIADPAALAAHARRIAAALRGEAVDDAQAQTAAQALAAAEQPLLVAGASLDAPELLSAAAELMAALRARGRPAQLAPVWTEANSLGLQLFGGEPLDALFAAIADGTVRHLIVVENDLYRRAPKAQVDAALDALETLVVIDCIDTPTAQRADLFLPAGSFAEADGTFVNAEGRAQRHFQAKPPDGVLRESWRWLQQAAREAGADLGQSLGDLTRACAEAVPELAGIVEAAPPADFRVAGMRIPRQPHRYSGRTAMHADRSIREPRPPEDPDSPLAFSMEGLPPQAPRPPALIPIHWMPRWNSVQSACRQQDGINGPLRGGDPGVRLIAPAGGTPRLPPQPVPAEPVEGLRALPLHEIFASEELSQRAAPIRARAPQPCALLAADDARRMGLAEGGRCRIAFGGARVELPAALADWVPAGWVGLTAGAPGMPYFACGDAVAVQPAEAGR